MACWMEVRTGLVGVANSYLTIPSVNQNVALLVNCNPTGGEKGGFLRGVAGCNAAVAFAAYRPLLMSPRDDVLVFAHSTSPISEKRQLNYLDNSCLKKCDTSCRG